MPTPYKNLELTDPETDETIERSGYILMKCAACNYEWTLEFGANHLAGPCPECSKSGTEENRIPTALTVLIRDIEFVQMSDEIESETKAESVLNILQSNMDSWIRRIRNMTTAKNWELEKASSIGSEKTEFRFRREITADDDITYDSLLAKDEKYEESMAELKAKSNN